MSARSLMTEQSRCRIKRMPESKTENPPRRSKHRNQSKRKMELRNRRMDQIAGPNLAPNTAVATANSLTPFLRLPQELKNRIYELVLGGNLLHIKRDLKTFERDVIRSTKGTIKEQRLANQICSSQVSEKNALDCFQGQDGSSLIVEGIEQRHFNCHPSKYEGSTYIPNGTDISLLHTCRQIYNEARFIPYSTNIFSFNTPRNLRAFVHLLTRRSLNVNQAIRSIHIDPAYDNSDLHAWTQALKAVVQHMTLLKKVYVNLDERSTQFRFDYVNGERHISLRPLQDCLAILSGASTRSIEIVVSDRHLSSKFGRLVTWDPDTQAWGPQWRCTVEEKIDWAEEVEFGIQDRQSMA